MNASSLTSKLFDTLGTSGGKVKWWHAALFLAGITVVERLSTGRKGTQNAKEIYEDENQPAWAPPAGVFGPAWGINSLALTWAGQRLLNAPETLPNRKALLGLQAAHWLIYSTFGTVYFRKKSPVLAAAWTVGDAAVAWSSYLLARKGDPKLANAYLPLVAWTSFASTLAAYQALYNPDPLLDTPQPLELEGVGEALRKEN
jgi:tryptophan-rich sensory protein